MRTVQQTGLPVAKRSLQQVQAKIGVRDVRNRSHDAAVACQQLYGGAQNTLRLAQMLEHVEKQDRVEVQRREFGPEVDRLYVGLNHAFAVSAGGLCRGGILLDRPDG